MTAFVRPSTAPSHMPISFWQLLGMQEGSDPGLSARLRAMQLHVGRRSALLLLAVNLLSAIIVFALFSTTVPLALLLGWAVALATIAAAVTLRRLRSARVTTSHAGLGELRGTAIEGLALAAGWSIPSLVFANGADPTIALALAILLCVIMTAAAVTIAPRLPSTLLFIVGATVAASWPLLALGQFIPATAILAFSGLIGLACVIQAHTFATLRATALMLGGRDETVTLLLGDFDDCVTNGLWQTDAQRRLSKVTPRFAAMLGRTPEQLEGTPLLKALSGPHWEDGAVPAALHMLAERLKRRESLRDLSLPVSVGSERRWWKITASPRFDERGIFTGYHGISTDITEQRASDETIHRMARFDTLTGLPNRQLVNETLARALAEAEKWGRRATFMMIDLDRFKAVNDTLGHPIGDRLLGLVSARLGRLMTGKDLIGRLGGDEFAVVVHDAIDHKKTGQLAQTIIETLSHPYDIDEHTLYIGASIGIATYPRDGHTAETLVRSADLALYRSKDAGGGVFHTYEPQLHSEAEERRRLELALRKALDNGELSLDYQPVVDAASETLKGFEALLRWHSPEFGNVSPAKFIRIAEDTRLIGPIGEWVVRTACEEAARWPGETSVAVNVSAIQLHNPGFVTVVAQALSSSGLPAHRLELEVTESVFMKEGTGAVRTLEQILDLGVRLSLDDFGTGYSSLGYLSRTRFSSIKIDRSFVASAARGVPEATAIIRAVVALATSLRMATTAEGVETAEELEMVRNLGCTGIQGHYFGRALPVLEARALAARTDGKPRAAA